MTDKPEYCPTQNGTFTGYTPEWKLPDGWSPMPIKSIIGKGIPFPKQFGGILETIWLFGYDQAKALEYQCRAHCASIGQTVETRIAEYEITYDIKAKRIEEDHE